MQVSRKTLAGVSLAVVLSLVAASWLPSSVVQAKADADKPAAETTTGAEEGADADDIFELKKPPKPEPPVTTEDAGIPSASVTFSTPEAKKQMTLPVGTPVTSPAYSKPRRIVDDTLKQHTADLAGKMLGLELEEVGRDEIKGAPERLRGGLRFIQQSSRKKGIIKGDILLGPHIWETASLQDLGYILTRQDISKLSPIKCYLLRGGTVHNVRLQVTVPARGRGAMDMMGGGPGRGLGGMEMMQGIPVNNKTAPLGIRSGRKGAKQPAAINKSALRYDGKSFDEWRKQWRTELNPKSRTEAVRAFATFAKNGYDREAAEVIVEVIKQYDFYTIDGSLTGKLKQAAIEAFVSVDPKVRNVILIDALKSSNGNAQIFASHIVNRSGHELKMIVPALLKIIQDKANDPHVRRAAVRAIVKTDRSSEEADQALKIVMKDDDPVVVESAIRMIMPPTHAGFRDGSPLWRGVITGKNETYLQHLIDAVSHSDSGVRVAAYRALSQLGPKSKPAVPALVKALQEDKDNDELIGIVNTLGKIGPAAEEAVPALVELWKKNPGDLPEQERLREAIRGVLGRIAPEAVKELQREE